MAAQNADSRAADPAAATFSGKEIVAEDTTGNVNGQASPVLKAHFDRAVELLEQARVIRADLGEWRKQAKAEGLEPTVIVKLAREHLRDAEQELKAREAAEIEHLYRAGLGLPLFDWAAS